MSGVNQLRESPDSNPGDLTLERLYFMTTLSVCTLQRSLTSRHAAPVRTYGTLDPTDKGGRLAWLVSKLPCHFRPWSLLRGSPHSGGADAAADMPLELLHRRCKSQREEREHEHVRAPEHVHVPRHHPQGAAPRAPCTASQGRRPRRLRSFPGPCDAGGGGVGGRRRRAPR